MLDIDTEAPDFTIPDDEGNPYTLSGKRGSWVLLWWYPKADTPGCTLQGKGLRDQAERFAEAGTTILGISFDTPASNRDFKEKFDFPFTLLSDIDTSVGQTYGAQRDPGEQYADYPRRISYLIDPDGVIRRTYEVTDPAGHAEVVLADVAELGGG
jgi:peroxiredoxin Q/BCP